MANALLKRPRKGQVMISRDGRSVAPDFLTVADLAGQSGATVYAFKDSLFQIVGDVDPTKALTFQVDTQATTSTLNIDVGAQTASRTLTVPVLAGTDTIATRGVANIFSISQTMKCASGTANIVIDSTGAGQQAGFNFNDNGTQKWAFYKESDNTFKLYDFVNSFNALRFVQGAANSCYTNFFSTFAATSSLLGALVVGDAVTAATNVAIGGGKIYVGGSPPAAGKLNAVASSAGISLALSDNVNNSLYVSHVSGGPVLTTDSGGQISITPNGATVTLRVVQNGVWVNSDPGGTDVLRVGGATTIAGDLTLTDAKNIVVNATTGTKIATATTQKLGFWNAAPIAQKTGYGTPTGNSQTINFPGATATLVQTSQELAQLLLDLKAAGLIGA